MGNRTILFVSGSLNRGGAQRVITLLADAYAAQGWQVHIAVLLDKKHGYQISDAIEIHDLVYGGSQIRNIPKWVSGLKKVIKAVKPDAIVSFVGRVNIITMLAARGTGIPVLVSERNDPAHDRRSGPEKLLCKLFYKRADKVVFQTAYQAGYYKKWCSGNSAVIGNPIAAPTYTGEHPKRDIICVGKLMAQKNHPMMIRAFQLIAQEFPDREVFIFGEGAKRQELEAQIAEAGLTDRIHLPGNSDHIFDAMHEYAYFVMCSDYEGLSNALLEAMASGMICVTTAWNGADEIVEDGVNGYLVPVGDASALAETLRNVLRRDDGALRSRAVETGSRFSGEQVMEQWRRIIDGLCG